jgi:hypothetical protein
MKTLTINYASFEGIRDAVKMNVESATKHMAEANAEHNDGEWLWWRGAQCLSERALGWLDLIEKLGEVKEEDE